MNKSNIILVLCLFLNFIQGAVRKKFDELLEKRFEYSLLNNKHDQYLLENKVFNKHSVANIGEKLETFFHLKLYNQWPDNIKNNILLHSIHLRRGGTSYYDYHKKLKSILSQGLKWSQGQNVFFNDSISLNDPSYSITSQEDIKNFYDLIRIGNKINFLEHLKSENIENKDKKNVNSLLDIYNNTSYHNPSVQKMNLLYKKENIYESFFLEQSPVTIMFDKNNLQSDSNEKVSLNFFNNTTLDPGEITLTKNESDDNNYYDIHNIVKGFVLNTKNFNTKFLAEIYKTIIDIAKDTC